MAGSFSSLVPEDPILSARIESLVFLAGHIQEPVVILSPSFEVVYANGSAQEVGVTCPLVNNDVSEFQPDCSHPKRCELCPAKSVLDSISHSIQNFRNVVGEEETQSDCPFSRAMALFGMGNEVGSIVLMGNNGHETRVCSGQVQCASLGNREPATASSDHQLIGRSTVIEQVTELIKMVALSDAPVLLQGESGTGKELAARSIHSFSERRAGPFVVVDCGSLPETLLESELFGHVRGAFTGASATRKGLFEEAHGGTLFLDEVSNTSPAFQAKLLRVLQEGEIKPVGDNQSVRVDVRVLSATNTPLEKLVNAGSFRADLYFRLAVLPITLPPLRERLDDIPLLSEYFVRRACEKNGRSPVRVLPEVHQELMSRDWPGNVRELEHLLERAVLLTRDSLLTRRDIMRGDTKPASKGDLMSLGKEARAQVERIRIVEALQESQGSRTKAARLLNISRASLYNKLREYHIS